MHRPSYAKAFSCAIVLVGLAVPAASAFTLIELLDSAPARAPGKLAVPAATPQPPVPSGPSSMAAEQKGPQPIGLLLPAVQKVREEPRPCVPGQVAAPNGQGCQASGLGTAPR